VPPEQPVQPTRDDRLRAGLRAGLPFAIAGAVLALSFGVVAQDAGLSRTATIVMSVIVFAGSAQFTAIAIVAAGGTVGAAVVAAALIDSRFLPMASRCTEQEAPTDGRLSRRVVL
jgi:predicted branched-subunit amino acid permease